MDYQTIHDSVISIFEKCGGTIWNLILQKSFFLSIFFQLQKWLGVSDTNEITFDIDLNSYFKIKEPWPINHISTLFKNLPKRKSKVVWYNEFVFKNFKFLTNAISCICIGLVIILVFHKPQHSSDPK